MIILEVLPSDVLVHQVALWTGGSSSSRVYTGSNVM